MVEAKALVLSLFASNREENQRGNPSGMPIVARHDIVLLSSRRILCVGWVLVELDVADT